MEMKHVTRNDYVSLLVDRLSQNGFPRFSLHFLALISTEGVATVEDTTQRYYVY